MRLAYRLVANLGLLLTSTVAIFALVEASPGGLETVYSHSGHVGAGQPIFLQYFTWLFRVLSGDLGWSPSNGEAVSQAIVDRLPASIELAFSAFVASLVLGAAIGYGRARARASVWRGILSILELGARALPIFALIMFVELIAIFTRWIPTAGMSSDEASGVLDRLWHLIGPVLCLAVPFGAWSSLVFYELFREPGDGARNRATHLFGGIATNAALVGPALLSGALLVEPFVAWPGLARNFFNGMDQFDIAMVAGSLLIYSVAIVGIKIGADLFRGAPTTFLRRHDAQRPSGARRKQFSRISIVAFVALSAAAIGAVGAGVIAPAGPNVIDQAHWQGYPLPPGAAGHILGTDDSGYDMLARLLFALRTSLGIAILAAAIAAAIGAFASMLTRSMHWFDDRGALVATGIRPFAALPFMLATVMVLADRHHWNGSLVPLAIVSMIVVASLGAIVPAFRTRGPATLGGVVDLTACALLLEVTLSDIGFGVKSPTPSLGNMLRNAQMDIVVAPWAALVPIAVIVATLFALYAIGDDLRERSAS